MSEFLSTVIKSCRANFGVKWRVFFSTSIFVQKCQFWKKKIEVLWEMLTFWNYCALLLKVFFSTSIFVPKLSILGEKNWNFVRNFDFFKQVLQEGSVNILLENMLIFRKFWLFVWKSIYIKKLSNLIKTSIFLRKCLFVHVLIFIRVFLLLENCYFDSKYHFIRWYFGKSVIFLVKFTFQVA